MAEGSIGNPAPSEPSEIEKILERGMKNFRKKITYSMFTSCLPEIYKTNRALCKESYKLFMDDLTERLHKRTSEVLEKSNVIQLLHQLDDMQSRQSSTDAKKTANAWRPSGNAEKDIAAHLMSAKLEHRDCMKTTLEELKGQMQVFENSNREDELKLAQLESQLNERFHMIDKARKRRFLYFL